MTAPAVPPGYGPRHAQPLDRMMASLNGRLQSFGIFNDQPPPQPDPATPEDIEAMRAAAAIFATPEGATLLEWIADKTVRQPRVLPIEVDPMRGWADAQRREGRNDTFFLIVQLIAAAREEPAPVREGSTP